MVYGAVFAPNEGRWQGELILMRRKNSTGRWRESEFRRYTDILCPHESWKDDLWFDPEIPPQRVADILLYFNEGYMVRRSVAGTYERIEPRLWIRGWERNYPELAVWGEMLIYLVFDP